MLRLRGRNVGGSWKPLVLAALASAPCGSLGLSAQTPAAATTDPVPSRLVIAVPGNLPPFADVDANGGPSGFSVELIRAMGAELHTGVDVRLVPWSEVVPALMSGRSDAAVLPETLALRSQVDYLGDIWTMRPAFLFPPGSHRTSFPTQYDELGGERVGGVLDSPIMARIAALPQASRPTIVGSPTLQAAIDGLLAGRTTMVAGNELSLSWLLQRAGVTDAVVVRIGSVPLRLAVRKGRGGEFAALDQALDQLKRRGDLQRLVESSLRVAPGRELALRTLAPYGAAAALVVVVGLVSIATLRKAVATRTADLNRTVGELRRAQAALHSLHRAAGVAGWRIDPSTGAVTLSAEWFELAGEPEPGTAELCLPPAEADALFRRVVHPEDWARFAGALEQARSADALELAYRLVARDGEVRHVLSRFRRETVVAAGDQLFASTVDITAREHEQAALTAERQRLDEHLQTAKQWGLIGQLAGGIAHDFNNLLTVVNGYASLLVREFPGNDHRGQFASSILKAGEQAACLTRQLLALGRRENTPPEPFDLNALIVDGTDLFTRLLGEDRTLQLSLTHGLPPVLAVRAQIHDVLMNLVANARDALSPGGTVTITTSRDHPESAPRPGPYVLVSVRDTGVGMDESTQARIFDPFFTTKARDRGTGLGLSTVLGVIQGVHGTIEVRSTPGAGTEMRIFLPEAIEAVPARSVQRDAGAAGGQETILVVEDELDVRRFTLDTLTRAGYRVIAAASGEAAMAAAASHDGPLHLLLSDVVMPGLRGNQLADNLLAERPALPVILMSGYRDTTPVREGWHYLVKPFTSDGLLRKVREALDAVPRLDPVP